MKIKFTRSILVHGEHCEIGSIGDFPEVLAIELIRAGDAVREEEHAKETAEAKIPAKETVSKK